MNIYAMTHCSFDNALATPIQVKHWAVVDLVYSSTIVTEPQILMWSQTHSMHLLFVEDIVAISHLACIPVIHLILAILMCMMMCADISYIISVQYVSWLDQL